MHTLCRWGLACSLPAGIPLEGSPIPGKVLSPACHSPAMALGLLRNQICQRSPPGSSPPWAVKGRVFPFSMAVLWDFTVILLPLSMGAQDCCCRHGSRCLSSWGISVSQTYLLCTAGKGKGLTNCSCLHSLQSDKWLVWMSAVKWKWCGLITPRLLFCLR